MSETQQNTTNQPEEVKEPQPAGDVQVESANDKVVESTEKSTEESKSTEKVEPESEQTPAAEPSDEETKSEEKVAEGETKALDSEEQKVEQAADAETKKVEAAVEPAAETVNGETTAAETDKAAESNGDAVEATTGEQQQPPQVEETNGVGKRKVENGAEAVEEEKSPKKAKVVDEGDQSAPAVEERAA